MVPRWQRIYGGTTASDEPSHAHLSTKCFILGKHQRESLETELSWTQNEQLGNYERKFVFVVKDERKVGFHISLICLNAVISN